MFLGTNIEEHEPKQYNNTAGHMAFSIIYQITLRRCMVSLCCDVVSNDRSYSNATITGMYVSSGHCFTNITIPLVTWPFLLYTKLL